MKGNLSRVPAPADGAKPSTAPDEGANERTEEMSTRPYTTLTERDVAQPFLQIGGAIVRVSDFMGIVQLQDVGKRVYLVDGVPQVENDEQFRARLAKPKRGCREGSPNKERQPVSLALDYEEHGGYPVDLVEAFSTFTAMVKSAEILNASVQALSETLFEQLHPDTRRKKFTLRLSTLVTNYEKFNGALNRVLLMQPIPPQSEEAPNE